MPATQCIKCGEFEGCMCKLRAAKRNRYGNVAKRTEYNGVAYPSKAEAEYAARLDLMVKGGLILGWIRQVTFPLVPKTDTAKGVTYRVDFMVFTAPGECHVVDVKGVETGRFKIIRELWRERGPCDLRIFKKRGKSWDHEVIPGKQGDE